MQPEILDNNTAILLGKEIANEQITPRQIAGIFAAVMSCSDRFAVEGVLLGLIDGIGLGDPDACESVEEYIRKVAQLYAVPSDDFALDRDA